MTTIQPHKINPHLILNLDIKPEELIPIQGLNIPNVIIPSKLRGIIRSVSNDDPITIQIRQLLNSATIDNINVVTEKLKNLIVTKVQKESILEEIAKELFDNFLVSDKNIPMYLKLLNSVYAISISLAEDIEKKESRKVSKSIGNYFLDECKNHFLFRTTETHLRKIVVLDQDDPDEADKYNRERDQINNIIITICSLYGQRETSYIRLNAVQVYQVFRRVLDLHKSFQEKMNKLGNPYEDEECDDEEEYENLRNMSTLCAEQLYTFISQKGTEFVNDKVEIKGETLSVLLERFRDEVIPNLVEDYLESKCKSNAMVKLLSQLN